MITDCTRNNNDVLVGGAMILMARPFTFTTLNDLSVTLLFLSPFVTTSSSSLLVVIVDSILVNLGY